MAVTDETIQGVGHSRRRVEDDRLIRGQGNFVEDISLPGMLHMALLRTPLAHAEIRSIDTSGSLKVPGVVAVVTGKDLEAHGLAWMPTLSGTRARRWRP
jgi:carbon-monoxide dehydrogenase large subunit